MRKDLNINTQKAWGWKVAAYLFLAGAGAGSYLAAFTLALIGPRFSLVIRIGTVLSIVLIIAGIFFLIFDLGKKSFAFLAFSRPGHSWISRGTIFITAFILFDFLYILMVVWPYPGNDPASGASLVLGIVTAVMALLTLTYTGMVLGFARPVAFWNPGFLTVLFLVSGITSGIAGIVLCLSVYHLFPGTETDNAWHALAGYNAIILTLEAAVIFLYFFSMSRLVKARASVRVILRGRLSPLFWGVIIVGLVLSLSFDFYVTIISSYDSSYLTILSIAANTLGLLSGFMLRYVIIAGGAVAPLNIRGIYVPFPQISPGKGTGISKSTIERI